VSVGLILENLGLNIHNAKAIIKKAVATLPPYKEGACDCRDALKNTIVTNPGLIPQAVKKNLKLIIDRYIK
jgi:hypothetical protein